MRHGKSDAAFFVRCHANRQGAVSIILEGADRQIIAILRVNRTADFRNVSRYFLLRRSRCVCCGCPIGRHSDRHNSIDARINSGHIHVDNLLALLTIGRYNRLFKMCHCLVDRNNVSQLEERGLTNHIDTTAEAKVFCNLSGVDNIELQMLFSDSTLHGSR